MDQPIEVIPVPADPDDASKKNSVEKCKHFSMRKYVSEKRQSDATKGWPFKLDYISSEVPKDVLPSLDVPEFRWWKCRYCLPEFWVTDDLANGAVKDASCRKCKLGGAFANPVILGETATLTSDYQLMLSLDMTNRKISAEISPNKHSASVLSIDDGKDIIVQNCSKVIEEVDGNNIESETDETRGSNFKQSPALCYNGNGSLADENVENASKTVEADKQEIDGKVAKECENEKVGFLDCFVGHGNEPPPADLDQPESPSSDSTEVGPHKSGSSCRRKSRKLRLLTDLLSAVEDTSNSHIRKDNSPLPATCNASRELRKQAVAEGGMADCGNAKVFLKKKRKLTSEDSMKSSKHVRKNHGKDNPIIFIGTAKNGDDDLDSPSEDNELTGMFSQTSTKSHLPEHVKKPLSKKKKKNQVISSEIKHTSISSDGNEFANGALGTTLSPSPGTSKSICFFKEKNNLPPVRPVQVPTLSQDTSSCSGRPIAMTDKNVGEHLPDSVQYWSAKPFSAVNGTRLASKTGSNVSLGSDKFFISEMTQGPSSPGMEDVFQEGVTTKDNAESSSMHVDRSFPAQHVSNAFRPYGVNGIINDGNNYRIPFVNERHRCAPNMVDQRYFWTQNLGISGATKKKKADKNLEHMAVAQQCHDQSADPGNPDDIPMEIVELMAKNQYERCLQDAEMEKIPVSRAKKVWDSEIAEIAREDSRRKQNLWLSDSSQKCEFLPQNGRTVMASKDFGSSAQKSYNISSDVSSSSYKANQVERYHMPPVPRTFFNDQGMPPCNFPSNWGPSNLRNTPSNVMNEDCSRNKGLDGNFLSLGVSGLWHPPKQSEELPPRNSSMRPDSIPFVYGILPQSCGLHPNSINFQPHCPRTPPKVEMNCTRDPRLFFSRAGGLQKPEKDSNSEAHRGANMKDPPISRLEQMEHEDRRLASLDISSNETIPAMHLLSLMDGGMPSGKKIGLDENARLSKQPSSPCRYHAKEICGLNLGLCKTCIPLRRPSFDYDHQAKVLPGKYQELSAAPAFSLSASSSRPANIFSSGSVGKPRVPLDVNEKGKGKCYKVGSSGVAPSPAGNVGLETSYGFKPYHNMERNFPNSSGARVVSQHQRMSEIQAVEAQPQNEIRTAILLPRNNPEVAICKVNRNPSEFSVPEEGNVYSIGRDDLKHANRVVRNKPKLANEHCRRKKIAKLKHAAGTSQNRPQTS
ncbi:hypothetical protein MLD38_014650 [Melastoma candidum]|uniref:Uncharacterized protein n=1 Tax=Melastoma candidum TaxID=119954 RepID=A0ACB9RDK9_9MYRT|nr:hypothetical protein MLD38_014650 [Melastoma candidum]